jgi:hypothetical protein
MQSLHYFSKIKSQKLIAVISLLTLSSYLAAQNVVLESSVMIDASLTLKHGSESIVSNNQQVNVGDRTYIRINVGNQFSQFPFVKLSDGNNIGQILILESTGFISTWQLDDNSDDITLPGHFGIGNINLHENRILSSGDVIQLIWNGTEWLEMYFSDN